LVATTLPEAWPEAETTVLAIAGALSKKAGRPLHWAVVRESVDTALKYRLFERTAESGAWPCDYSVAHTVFVRAPKVELPPELGPTVVQPTYGAVSAQAELKTDQLQDLVDRLADFKRTSAGVALSLRCGLP
jgi:hypothetical protein